ncbi:hypothetical protein EEL31_13760 [Brevibacillus laterosporus]|nr:hypothetical protein [Brevibacillus laterosporus]TPG69475.1 hypothetical protein EEL31_13760 [Brevibacillus laterosporus]
MHKKDQVAHAIDEVINVMKSKSITLLLISTVGLLSIAGCGGNRANRIQSMPTTFNPHVYFLQSHPQTATNEDNFTPYGMPVNSGSGTDYDLFIRPDSVSNYGGFFGKKQIVPTNNTNVPYRK